MKGCFSLTQELLWASHPEHHLGLQTGEWAKLPGLVCWCTRGLEKVTFPVAVIA